MSNARIYGAVFIIRALYSGMQIISKIAFTQGMSTFVFSFYRQAFATLFLAPIALIFERKNAPPLSPLLCFKIFAVSLFSITGTLTLYNISLAYTTSTLASALSNIIPVVTFILSVVLRIETVRLKKLSGIAKVFGVGLCVAGIITIAFYKGPFVKPINHHHHHLISHGVGDHGNGAHHEAKSRGKWIMGTFIMITANSLWSSWIVFQVFLLKEYPSMLLLITLESFFSTIQTFLLGLAIERDLSRWKLEFNMSLFATAYSGIVVTGILFCLQSWCIKKRGPVFLAMSAPLTLVITIAISLFILGEEINLQSILGGILMIGGLYSVLFGKSKEEIISKTPTLEEEKQTELSLP